MYTACIIARSKDLFQLEQNAAARLLTGTMRREHIPLILAASHCSKNAVQNQFIAYKGLKGLDTSYISDLQEPLCAGAQTCQQKKPPKSGFATKGDDAFTFIKTVESSTAHNTPRHFCIFF